jgi:triacylglycerol esterase/lipase EstA (alpha/beta hydrolase family)
MDAALENAQYLFFNPSSVLLADYVEGFLQKITFTSSIDRQMAAGLSRISGKVDAIGYSQGALTLSNALINLGVKGEDKVGKATYRNYPISQLRGAISSWVSGAHPEYGTNTFDPFNVAGPNLNPVNFIGGMIGGLLFQGKYHSLDKND